jgi:Acyl-CoA carboxylase epsilon subunit
VAIDPPPSPGPTQPEPGSVRPVLRVVRGAPTDDEVAALVVALLAATSRAGAAPAPGPSTSLWRNRSRNIRPAVSPSPGAWRASGLPR